MEAKRSRKHEDDVDGVSLPEDVIFDVLIRLPVKALCRFRSVSRAWRALISEPAFVTAQRSHAGPHLVAMFGSWPDTDYDLRVLDMDGNVLRVFEGMGSPFVAPTRLDLICIDRRSLGATIVDPAARRAFTVGRHVHDQEIWWSNYSFGRAAPSGAYKVLRFSENHATVCEVATITDDGAEPTWRRRPMTELFHSFSSEHKASVNGVLYFISFKIYERTPDWNRVAVFDLESEVWMSTINGPPLEEQKHWWIALTQLKESLCMVHNTQHADGHVRYSNIWRLIDHNKGVWVKAYKIWLPTECSYFEPLDVLDDGTILLLNSSCSRFILQYYNPSTEAFMEIMEMAEGFSGIMTFYTGSLLSS